jgi:GT2 family glycosyltransferase
MVLSIIVVNYQGLSLLEGCLRSISTHLEGRLEYEVWVVDNASTDGSPEWLKRHAAQTPGVTPILNPKNFGFAAANNTALRQCRGEFALLLNSDALLIDDSVLKGIEFLRNHPDAFGAGARLWNGDGTPGPSYGFFPHAAILAREFSARAFGSLRAVSPKPDEKAHPIDFPCGAYFLVNTRWLDKVGLLDETFFLYFEETDWARRAWNLGHPIQYLPECTAVHLGGGSSQGPENPAIVATFYESWRIYLRKHSGPFGIISVFSMLVLLFSWNALKTSGAGPTHRGANIRKHLRGVFWGFFGTPSRRLSGQ